MKCYNKELAAKTPIHVHFSDAEDYKSIFSSIFKVNDYI